MQSNFMVLDSCLFELSCKNTHTHRNKHTHMDAQTDSDKYSIVEFCKKGNYIKLGPITRLRYAVMFVCPLIGISGVCGGWGHGNVSPVLRRCKKKRSCVSNIKIHCNYLYTS